MKIIHLSDLHIGKRVNEFSMIEDQTYVFRQILDIIKNEEPDAVLISGDVYDKAIPSEEAVSLCNTFLTKLSETQAEICVISGNHDSAERLSFGANLLKKAHIHIATAFHGEVEKVVISGKKDGACMEKDMAIYMVPFLKPSMVRRFFEEKNIVTYDDAARTVIETLALDHSQTNICMAHQFVIGATTCESEEGIAVGGLDQIGADVFGEFDYVALGHLHGPQTILVKGKYGDVPVRYCGTPLKYSFSEMHHKKAVTIVEFTGEDSAAEIRTVPLNPLRDLREVKGTYEEITRKDAYEGSNMEDYIHVVLTDEEDIPDAIGKLRILYPNIMKFDYDNQRTRERQDITFTENVELKTPEELFQELYELQNNQPMSEEQTDFLREIIEGVWGL